MSSDVLLKQRTQPWQVAVCLFVCAYLALGVATSSVRAYHWFMLLAIPGALLSAERGRRFFLDWAPLFAFWLVYDRLRLIQPLLYPRVSVEPAFLIERACFGWLAKGDPPAHAAFAWLASHQGTVAKSIEWTAQTVYFSHLFVVPLVIVALWLLGSSRSPTSCQLVEAQQASQLFSVQFLDKLAACRTRYRAAFVQFIRAFSVLNFSAIAFYLLLPVAPPWWVTLNGMTQPTAELVAQSDMSAAMHGAIIQGMIKNASQLFAAVPSLHGAYPVLLLLLFPRKQSRLGLAAIALYAGAMWAATVVLNQHYLIDLVAGALLALGAWRVELLIKKRHHARAERLEPLTSATSDVKLR